MPRFSGAIQWLGEEKILLSIRIIPLEGDSKPAIKRSRLVLPHPEGPIKPTNSPLLRVSSTDFNAHAPGGLLSYLCH